MKILNILQFLSGARIADANGNTIIKFPTPVVNAVNGITVSNAASGSPPEIIADGPDNDIGINIKTKGAGNLTVNGTPLVPGSTGGTVIINSPTEPAGLNAGDWWYEEI